MSPVSDPATSRLQLMLGRAQWAALALLAALLLAMLTASLWWRMEHDTPLLHYMAFLYDRFDLVPYRDVFETSMPGTVLFHYAIGHWFGYGDLAFRLTDIVLLSALLLATYRFGRRFGRATGLWAVVLFGLIYLSKGQTMSLQRDYIGVIPIAFALLLLPRHKGVPATQLAFISSGVLFGLAALIKPHLAIGLPVIFCGMSWSGVDKGLPSFSTLLRQGAVTALGFAVPLVLTGLWLWQLGALQAFLDMALGYLPLHLSVSGIHETLEGRERVDYLLTSAAWLGGYRALLLSAAAAFLCYATLGQQRDTNIATLVLLTCIVAYAVYPVFGGKFWPYHYMPLAYFAALGASLAFANGPDGEHPRVRAGVGLLLLCAVLISLQMTVRLPQLAADVRATWLHGSAAHAPKDGRVDELAVWLADNVGPDQTVQPIDWVRGGALHAMLISETRLATRYLYSYHFYHHVDEPYIRGLRDDFLGQLANAPPDYLLDMRQPGRGFVWGKQASAGFAGLDAFIDQRYAVAVDADDYRIYALRPLTPPADQE